jgi:diguanylate cyclase (GGDEF)-like protein
VPQWQRIPKHPGFYPAGNTLAWLYLWFRGTACLSRSRGLPPPAVRPALLIEGVMTGLARAALRRIVKSPVARLAARLAGAGPPVPAEVQLPLITPLFERPASLMLGHSADLLLCLIAILLRRDGWAVFFMAIQVAFAAGRILLLLDARRNRARLGPQALLRAAPGYFTIGIAWAAMNGAFNAWAATAFASDPLGILTLTVAMGTCAGITGRNAGTARFAKGQIACMLVPLTASLAIHGGWGLLLALLIALYLIAVISIVSRLHADLVNMFTIQRSNAALTAHFDAALSNMSQGLILYDADRSLRVINRRFFALFGVAQGSLQPGQSRHDVLLACIAAGAVAPTTDTTSLEELAAAGGHSVLELADGRAIAVSHDALADGGSISTFEDVTERRRGEARIVHMARHDALTGLPNRLLFRDRLDQAVAWLGRGEGFSLACLDLDHFKTVNDTLGHGAGDQLLKAVAERLLCCLREVDTVARLGGDEFALILPGLTDNAEAQALARRLIDTISRPYTLQGHLVTIGMSVGMAMAPRDGSAPDALLTHADLALYEAKAAGRGTVAVFDQTLSTRLSARRALEQDLRGGVSRGEFELQYQPIVSVRTGCIVGLEALLRWNHPQLGCMVPGRFIGMAEESGLIEELGDWAMGTACRQAATWPRPVAVAVNVSAAQFRAGHVLQSVQRALDASGLPPWRLELEITEAALLRDMDGTLSALRGLRALGARLTFDDFGTGFSSLAHLHRFPFDKIKIDGSFIRDMGRSPSAAAIVGAIAGLGSSLNVITTAEEVETMAQLEQLRSLGCAEAQGHYFSRPARAEDVAQLLLHSITPAREAV